MDDPIIQVEVVLNFVNSLITKAVYYKDTQLVDELSDFRHEMYYGDEKFDYEAFMKKLKEYDELLKKYG